MAGKSVKTEIPYREGGVNMTLPLTIGFISNYVFREYNMIMSDIATVKILWDRFSDVMTEFSAAKKEKKETEQLEKEIEELNKEILLFSDKEHDFFKRRFNLLSTILKDNGVQDEKFFDFEFWDRQVEPGDIIDFLDVAVYKDIDKKKVV